MQSDHENLKLRTNGDEWDVFSDWRRAYVYTGRAGVCKWVKRNYRKRLRRRLKQDIIKDMYE